MDDEFSQPSIILDSSALLSKVLPNEKTPAHIKKLFKDYESQRTSLLAPTILKYEAINGLRSAALQKKITHNLAVELYDTFVELDIIYLEPNYYKSLKLALKHKLSVYDAAYLVLAIETKSPLVTLDKKLAKLAIMKS